MIECTAMDKLKGGKMNKEYHDLKMIACFLCGLGWGGLIVAWVLL